MDDLKLASGDTMVLLSGGIDSTVLLQAVAREEPGRVAALFVDFGQTPAVREQAAAQRITNRLGIPLHVGDLSGLAKLTWGEEEPPHVLIAERAVDSAGIQPQFARIAAGLGFRNVFRL